MKASFKLWLAILTLGTGCNSSGGDGGECPRVISPFIYPTFMTCRPNGALFEIKINSAAPRNDIDLCRMSITNE
jgi:hypothetical protein